ncbi:hypothetical protein Tco_0484492, partial [Tanacetum coccineum]
VAKPDDLFSLNNGRLTTSFLDSLLTATGENVQKVMSCILVHGRKIFESPWGSPISIGDGDGDVNRFPDGDEDGDGDEAEKRG